MEARLDLEHQLGAELTVGEVLDVGDALQLLAGDELLDLGDHAFGPDAVGQFGDRDRALAPREGTHLGGRAHADDPTTGLVGGTHLGHAQQLSAGGQVGPWDEAHQLVEAGVGVRQQVPCRVDDLDEVVRDHVGGHADRDAGRAVDEQVRHRRGKHRRLLQGAVVVVLQVDGLLVEPVGEQQGGGRQAAFCVVVDETPCKKGVLVTVNAQGVDGLRLLVDDADHLVVQVARVHDRQDVPQELLVLEAVDDAQAFGLPPFHPVEVVQRQPGPAAAPTIGKALADVRGDVGHAVT